MESSASVPTVIDVDKQRSDENVDVEVVYTSNTRGPITLDPPITTLKEIHDDDFNSEVLSHAGLAVVVFTSYWCGPCKKHSKLMEEVMNSSVLSNKRIKFLSVDTDENPVSSTEFQVRSIPSTMLFKNGRLVSEIVGAVPKHLIEREVLKHSLVNLPDISVSTFE